MKEKTAILHSDTPALPESNKTLTPRLYPAVKYAFESLEEMEKFFNSDEEDGFFYARRANPNGRQLELLLARLQGTEDGLVFHSGLSALATTFFSLLEQGQHVIVIMEGYKPARGFLRQHLCRYGVSCDLLSLDELERLDELFQEGKTRFVHFESPTNPTLRIADINLITRFCREKGVLSILDNTVAGFHQHGSFQVDLYIHSLTKYGNGMGDAMGGVVLGSRDLIKRIHEESNALGNGMDPYVAQRFTQGMKTYFERYRAQSAQAKAVAEFLEQEEGVTKVLYPGLPSHPDHELAKKQMQDFGQLIHFEIEGGEQAMRTLLDRLKLIKTAASFGDLKTIIAPSKYFYGGDLSHEQCEKAGLKDSAMRLSVGLEEMEDIQDDLAQALKEVKGG